MLIPQFTSGTVSLGWSGVNSNLTMMHIKFLTHVALRKTSDSNMISFNPV